MDPAYEALTDHRTHRTAHEREFERCGHQRNAVNCPSHDHQRVGFTGLFHRLLKTIRIFTTVAKFQRIDRYHFLADLKAPFGIEQPFQPRSG